MATLLSLARTQTGKVQHGGLSKAMARYKLQFVGKAHRAHVDAFNTLRLFFAILERQRILEGRAARMKSL
jgi:inhibitor of KinA sporulation pathway (predicted exonuclease)